MWFNIELAKKHPDSLEYIVVHELTHLRERNHGAPTRLASPAATAQQCAVGERGLGWKT